MPGPAALALDHIAYPVGDAAATLHFYRDVLGLPLVQAFAGDDWGGHPWLMMIFALGDGRQLALSALQGSKAGDDGTLPPDVRHVSLTVADEEALAAWRDRLAAHDVAHWEEDHGAQTSLYFTDPSNVILEITTPASQNAQEPDPDAEAVVTAWLRKG